jgi:hypothetical protein
MNILDPIFYRTLFYDFCQWTPRDIYIAQIILQGIKNILFGLHLVLLTIYGLFTISIGQDK